MERLYDFEEECVEGYFRESDIALQQSTEERIKTTNERVENMSQKVEDINQKENLQSATVQVMCLFLVILLSLSNSFPPVFKKTCLNIHTKILQIRIKFQIHRTKMHTKCHCRIWTFGYEKWKNPPNKFYLHWLLFIDLCRRIQHCRIVCKDRLLMFLRTFQCA